MKAFTSRYANMAEYSFDSTRKHEMIARKLSFIKGIEIVETGSLPLMEIQKIHSAEYVGAVVVGREPLASSSMLPWDKNTLKRALGSCGALMDSAFCALKEGVAGSVVSGFHHAEFNRGAGFCTFNGLVVTAKAIQEKFTLDEKYDSKVLILDLDYHTGNGTEEIINRFNLKNIRNLTVFGSSFGVGYGWNYKNANEYCTLIDKAVKQINGYDFVIYQAGMDSHQDSAGGMQGVTTQLLLARDREVFSECNRLKIPVCFCMAGGYSSDNLTKDELADLHVGTFKQAVDIYK